MKKFTLFIVTGLLLIVAVSCKAEKSREERLKEKKKIVKTMDVPAGVKPDVYIEYLAEYGPEWDDYTMTTSKALDVFKSYFKEMPYRVIWHWDIDGDGYKDYLGVEVYQNVRRGIKRGILVDEIGDIKLYIYTIKGVYTKDEVLLDLLKIGYRPNEIECFAIGYINYLGKGGNFRGDVGVSSEEIKKIIKKYKNTRITRSQIGTFTLQRLDKDLHNIGSDYIDKNASYRISDGFFIWYDLIKEKGVIELFTGFSKNMDEAYQELRYLLNRNRQAKRNGKLFRPPTELNKSDIEKALYITNELDL